MSGEGWVIFIHLRLLVPQPRFSRTSRAVAKGRLQTAAQPPNIPSAPFIAWGTAGNKVETRPAGDDTQPIETNLFSLGYQAPSGRSDCDN